MDESASAPEAKAVAESAARTYQEIGLRLIPVIGSRGFQVLFARVVNLTKREYPWLSDIAEEERIEMSYQALTASLRSQSGGESLQAHEALLGTLLKMLNTMIGEELTGHLLETVVEFPPSFAKKDQE